jgi:hypothetical protein
LKVEETVVQDNFVGDSSFLDRRSDLESTDLPGVDYIQAILRPPPPPTALQLKSKSKGKGKVKEVVIDTSTFLPQPLSPWKVGGLGNAGVNAAAIG